jgi:hypothetical protein
VADATTVHLALDLGILREEPRARLVAALFGGQIAQELADGGVVRVPGGAQVEPLALGLHDLRVLAHLVDAERPQQPDRLALHEAADVLAADERDVIAELRTVEIEETMAMAVFLLRHGAEHACRAGI